MADDCQPHRGPAIFLFFMNSSGSGIVAANHRTSVYERLLIWTGHAKAEEIDDEEENRGVRRQFFPFGNIIVGRDARRPTEPSVHLFSSERGPGAGPVRARHPAKSMNSVFEREPWTGKSEKRNPGAGPVRAHLPAKSMNSVFDREPWTVKSEKRNPGAGAVRARLPAKPMNSVFEREPWDAQNGKTRPTRRRSLKQSGGAHRPGNAS